MGWLPSALQKHSPGLGNVLLLNLGHSHMGVYVCKNSLSHTRMMCILYVFKSREINLEIKVFKVFKEMWAKCYQSF